jgi:hypothetical protein
MGKRRLYSEGLNKDRKIVNRSFNEAARAHRWLEAGNHLTKQAHSKKLAKKRKDQVAKLRSQAVALTNHNHKLFRAATNTKNPYHYNHGR